MKHRITFMSIWIGFTIALIIFPGFEVRGLAMGMIILSGANVALLAWLLDKAKLTKRIWI